jgi:hypothetical protein
MYEVRGRIALYGIRYAITSQETRFQLPFHYERFDEPIRLDSSLGAKQEICTRNVVGPPCMVSGMPSHYKKPGFQLSFFMNVSLKNTS